MNTELEDANTRLDAAVLLASSQRDEAQAEVRQPHLWTLQDCRGCPSG